MTLTCPAPLRLPTLRLATRTTPAAPTRSLIVHATAEVNAFAQQSSDLDDTTKEALRAGLRTARAERLELIETAPAPQIKTLPALPLTTERQLLEDLR